MWIHILIVEFELQRVFWTGFFRFTERRLFFFSFLKELGVNLGPTLNPNLGSCASYPEARLAHLAVVM